MRRTRRARLTAIAPALLPSLVLWVAGTAGLLAAGCGGARSERIAVPDRPGRTKSAASLRAGRRAYDGAPPTMPHREMGIGCVQCHNASGMAVPDLGFAPPSPHEATAGMSSMSRCRQCHVATTVNDLFVANTFEGLRQDLRHGPRLNSFAPPTIPHETLMRENCLACHSGPAAREEIRTSHPERPRCVQCHAAVKARTSVPFG